MFKLTGGWGGAWSWSHLVQTDTETKREGWGSKHHKLKANIKVGLTPVLNVWAESFVP